MTDPSQDLNTYRGSCHCKAFVYEAKVPEINEVFECNCSICRKKGYLLVVVKDEEANFQVVQGSEDDLTTYSFGTGKYTHKFCSTCGTPMLCRQTGGGIVLNAHAIQGIDTWLLKKSAFDGAAMGEPYQPPAHKGELPAGDLEGGRVYTGSCHCGNVTLAVKTKPLDETYEDSVAMCNCSICERLAAVWIFTTPQHVVLAGNPDDIGAYTFARNFVDKTFCKKCGVLMTNRGRAISEEELQKVPAQERVWAPKLLEMHPVNVRALEGVDLSKLKISRPDGAKLWPQYENP